MCTKYQNKKWYLWICTLILMLCYSVGEIGHFLIATLSKAIAQDIKFGNQRCLPADTNEFNSTINNRCKYFNSTNCGQYVISNKSVCSWDYDGSGVQYQVLAGPAFIAVFTISGIIIGTLGDIYNRVKLLTFCVFLFSLMAMLTGISTKYWHLIIFRIGFGIGEAGITPLSASIIADKFVASRRAFAMSFFNWGIYVGYGLAFIIGIYVTEENIFGKGWKISYYISGAPGILMAFLLYQVIKEPNRVAISDPAAGMEEIVDEDSVQIKSPLLEKFIKSLMTIIKRPTVMLLLLAATVRHTASFCWAYNSKLYFENYFPGSDVGIYIAFASIVGGSFGIITGGLVSDYIASSKGVRTRLWVLTISQAFASPLAAMVVYLPPPYCFISLFVAYFFAEMWFGILFTILIEIFPLYYRTTCISIFIFVINNVASFGQLATPYIRQKTSLRATLLITFAGFFLISAILFFVTQLSMSRNLKKNPPVKDIVEDGEVRHSLIE